MQPAKALALNGLPGGLAWTNIGADGSLNTSSPMNQTRIRRLTLAILAALVAGVVAVVAFIQLGYRQPGLVNGDRLVAALAQYAKDLRSHGQPLPSSVTLDTLIGSGYLRPEDAKPFEGVSVIFHSDAKEAYPQSILVEAHMPDGLVLVVLADGSVQALTPERFEEFRKTNIVKP